MITVYAILHPDSLPLTTLQKLTAMATGIAVTLIGVAIYFLIVSMKDKMP